MSDDTRADDASTPESTLRTEFTIAGPIPVPTSESSPPPASAQDLRADALADAGAIGIGAGTDGVTAAGTIVIEDGVIPKRLRRPLDLARLALALALAAASVALGWFATGTTSGLEEDLIGGARLLPDPVVLIINIIGGIGTLALPIAGAIAGGPGLAVVMLITHKLLQEPIDKLTEFEYRVTGPWKSPEVTRVDSKKSTAASENSEPTDSTAGSDSL